MFSHHRLCSSVVKEAVQLLWWAASQQSTEKKGAPGFCGGYFIPFILIFLAGYTYENLRMEKHKKVKRSEEKIVESWSQNGKKSMRKETKEAENQEVRRDVGRVKRRKCEIKERWEERKEEDEMKGKLEAEMAGGGRPQQGLQQAVAESRNISPSHCGPSTCFSSSFIISPSWKESDNMQLFLFSRRGKHWRWRFPSAEIARFRPSKAEKSAVVRKSRFLSVFSGLKQEKSDGKMNFPQRAHLSSQV